MPSNLFRDGKVEQSSNRHQTRATDARSAMYSYSTLVPELYLKATP
jgi:hypothetical protein